MKSGEIEVNQFEFNLRRNLTTIPKIFNVINGSEKTLRKLRSSFDQFYHGWILTVIISTI